MSTPKLKWCSMARVLLLGAAAMAAAGGCGRSGTGLGPGVDAGVSAGGGNGGEGGAVGTSSQGGTTDSTGVQGGATAVASGGQGTASSSSASSTGLGGFTTNPGGATSFGGTGSVVGGVGGHGGLISWAGGGGWGGASATGGVKSSGGSSGGKNATVKPPREPTSHRPKAPSCVFVRRAEPVNATDAGVALNGNCKTHADCVTRPNGECVNVSDTGVGRYMPPYYNCLYTLCATDADCTESELCDCRDGERGTCVGRGNCRVDADCGGGPTSYCSRAYSYDCGGHHPPGSYYCHTPKDTCITDADCTGKDYCDYEVITGRWECKSPNMGCVIG